MTPPLEPDNTSTASSPQTPTPSTLMRDRDLPLTDNSLITLNHPYG